MKRTKSLFALLVATVLALALVPGVAFGANRDSGDLEVSNNNSGTITIANPKPGETYTVYKIFDLASFDDGDPATGAHSVDPDQEAYSYVIKSDSGWLNFLRTEGPVGQAYTYARYSYDNGVATSDSGEYFVIDSNPITLKTGTNGAAESYYVVHPTSKFKNDANTNLDDMGGTGGTYSGRDDDAGTPAGVDYVDDSNANKIVQDFAQQALKYAASHTSGTGSVSFVAMLDSTSASYSNAPLGYYLVGTTMGTLASLDTNNKSVDIYEKNDEPSIVKHVLKKGATIPADILVPAGTLGANDIGYLTGTGVTDGDWVECTGADLEDYVQFRTIITAQQGVKDYKLHDVMEQGFEFVSADTTSVKTNRYKNDESTPADITTAFAPKVYLVRGNSEVFVIPATQGDTTTVTNWVLSKTEDTDFSTDGCDFEIAFKDATVTGDIDSDNKVVFRTAYGTDIDIKDGDKIVVLYWAKLNKDAVIFGDTETASNPTTIADNNGTPISEAACRTGDNNNTDRRNTNSTILTYGQGSHTAMAQAAVTTYQLDIVKTNEKEIVSGSKELLANAEFSLYKAIEGSEDGSFSDGNKSWVKESANALVFKSATNNEYYYAGDLTTTAGGTVDSLTTVNKLVSTADHEIHIEGLEDGTYLLFEDKAPTGYNKLSQPLIITINGDTANTITASTNEGTLDFRQTPNSNVTAVAVSNRPWDASLAPTNPVSYNSAAEDQGGIHIINQTGTELPSTGGLGTKAFYAIGGSLFAASVIFLTTKKRLKRAA